MNQTENACGSAVPATVASCACTHLVVLLQARVLRDFALQAVLLGLQVKDAGGGSLSETVGKQRGQQARVGRSVLFDPGVESR